MDIRIQDTYKLNKFFEVKTGTTPNTKNNKYWDTASINWLTPVDLGKIDGQIFIEESERKISEIALKEVKLNLMPRGSIVMSTRAPVGYLAVLKGECTFNQGCKGLLPRNSSETNTHYYSYYLQSRKYALQNRAGQSTFKELSKDMLEKFEVPIVSIDIQETASSILMSLDEKISLQNIKKRKLERIKKGLMNDLLTGRKRVKVN